MSEYRFHLERYRYGSKTDCPHCGRKRCFVRYVDEQGAVQFPASVGKCDHEQSCGYHYPPRSYFMDYPDARPTSDLRIGPSHCQSVAQCRPAPAEPSFIPEEMFRTSLSHYERNPLYRYLCGLFGPEETARLFRHYCVGTSAKWGGSTIFWQMDEAGRVRTGKVMLYNPATGRRVKDPYPYVSWAHTELRLPEFNLRQCLFGQHLLPRQTASPVMLVESEKSALIMCHFLPEYVWLATGGKNGCFNREVLQVLRGREVTLLPDLGATDLWRERSSLLAEFCPRVTVSDVLERMATDEQRRAGWDIADFFLMSPTQRQLLQGMIARNPLLQQLIDELDLVLEE